MSPLRAGALCSVPTPALAMMLLLTGLGVPPSQAQGAAEAAVQETVQETVQLDKVRLRGRGNNSRLELQFDGAVWGDASMPSQDRLQLDLVGVRSGENLKLPKLRDRSVREMRLGRTGEDTLRIEFLLARTVRHEWREKDGRSSFIVHLGDKAPVELRDIVIAVDAGHGGRDPGAINRRSKLYEKTVVLKIADELAKRIDKVKGLKAFRIRRGDESLHLSTRKVRARTAGADFFVSIHADAEESGRARGGSVFSLSSRGATNVAAGLLARRENQADDLLGDIPVKALDDDLVQVLTDLSVNAMQDRGAIAARMVLKHLRKVIRIHGSGTGQANFSVLRNHQIPSILVETGFISNQRDARNLNSWRMRQRIAQAVLDGIVDYFNRFPLPDTRFDQKQRYYKVRAGDTLSGIARREGVSVEALKAANNLKRDIIHKGQRLVIPK
ncbi:MAG: N-acetylmuramoyl-L-alanine amidase [Gammaproteobacteria bacterium AqS3]|nr:N-acetylmuramoyl-L-alanine amidase [Gammaproteobacteria bacterium AqS3]